MTVRRLTLALVATLFGAVTALSVTAPAAQAAPSLRIDLQKLSTTTVVVKGVCGNEQFKEEVVVGVTTADGSIFQGFALFDCTEKVQHFELPLEFIKCDFNVTDCATTLRSGELLSRVSIAFEGDSYEVFKQYLDMRLK